MNLKLLVRHLSRSTLNLLVIGILPVAANAEQSFLLQFRAPYSSDVMAVDRYRAVSGQHKIKTSDSKVLNRIRNTTSSSLQDKAGITVYKSMASSQNKFQQQAAGVAILYGAKYFGFGSSLDTGLKYLKDKTRYSFGHCSNVRLSTKRLKAQSCITDNAKVEFKSSYKLNSFTVDFKWDL